MKLKKLIATLSLASMAAIGSSAYAVPSITNLDGTLVPFGGFDWQSGAAAWTNGFVPVVGDTFTLNYAANAVAINDTGSGTLFAPHLDTNPNGLPAGAGVYEYTIFSQLTETVLSVNAITGEATFIVTGGTFNIFYDTAANANHTPGTCFLDGTKIISCTVNAAPVGQTFSNLTGGQATLTGNVTFTNSTFISPSLLGTTLTSTLQLGSAVTNFVTPTGFDFNNDGISDSIADPHHVLIVFQADANQSFTTVPEPGSLALIGSAFGLLGFFGRRRNQKAA